MPIPPSKSWPTPSIGSNSYFIHFLYFLEPFILKLTGGRGLTVPFITEEELKIMLDAGGKAGVLESDEVKMIKNVFEFNDVTAEDVMTPRIYMFMLDGGFGIFGAEGFGNNFAK